MRATAHTEQSPDDEHDSWTTSSRSGPAPKTTLMKHSCRQIRRMLASAAMALGCYVVGAVPVSADPGQFGTLGCSCQETAPGDSLMRRDELYRGIRDGLSIHLASDLTKSSRTLR